MLLCHDRQVPLTPTLLLVLLLLVEPGEACGRGALKGTGRIRDPPRRTPLVYKQHVPNLSENTFGASGSEEGRIRRGDARFKNLVENNNPDIDFKNEEGTGADRLMSRQCRECLNDLAKLVFRQWKSKNIKLRVTEAWDEDNMHAHNSLHYEGRAVDITTSDNDRAKYGMLARLAVEAGFDWVYYESRSHVHCSVKSDSSVAIKIGGCFSSGSRVTLSSGGTLPVSDLQIGQRVLAMNSKGQLVYSDVIGFLDRSTNKLARFYTLTTERGHSITLTAKHLIHTHNPHNVAVTTSHSLQPATSNSSSTEIESPSTSLSSLYSSSSSSSYSSSSSPSLKFAEDVKIGDYVIVARHDKNTHFVKTGRDGGEDDDDDDDDDDDVSSTTLQRVVSIELRTVEGYYAPLTAEGTIVVDGIVASCYAFLNSEAFVHSLFAPLRAFYAFKTMASDVWRFALGKLCWLAPTLRPFLPSPLWDSMESESRNGTTSTGSSEDARQEGEVKVRSQTEDHHLVLMCPVIKLEGGYETVHECREELFKAWVAAKHDLNL